MRFAVHAAIAVIAAGSEGRVARSNVGDVVAAKRPKGVRSGKCRIDLYVSEETVRRLGTIAGLNRVSPSEVADAILLRSLPEVPASYVEAASLAS